jgi:hypothetical protein
MATVEPARDVRYAVYFAPAVGSAWWRFGSSWLGRDAATGEVRPVPALPALDGIDLLTLTAAPRRYGFHATLVAPFALRADCAPARLHQLLRDLAHVLAPVPLGALQPERLERFVALRPTTDPAPTSALARACVLALDDVRAPLPPAEFERRSLGQDAHGIDLVRRHGYALVMDRFRFHMTLSGNVDAAVAGRVIEAAAGLVAPLNRAHPPVLDRLCLFVEPRPGEGFQRVADFEFGK